MKAVSLDAQKREIKGKAVKKLRKNGILPVGVYGKDVKSIALSVPLLEFSKVYKQVGETGLVELKYDGKTQPVLIKTVQFQPVTGQMLHAELHAVKLTEKITANIPIELVGESPAVKDNVGVLLQTINEVEVEALPTDLPEKIEVDVSKLAAVNDQVTVGQLTLPKGVEIQTGVDGIVVKVAPAVAEETAKEIAAEEAAKAAEETAEQGAATPAEGEGEKTEEKPQEAKEEK